MPSSRRIAAALACACLATSATASPVGPVHWVSICASGEAGARLLPVTPDSPGREERPNQAACHAVLAAKKKLLAILL